MIAYVVTGITACNGPAGDRVSSRTEASVHPHGPPRATLKEGIVDKRKDKRVPLEMGCWLVHLDEASCFHTLDVSITGMSVLMSDPLPVGKQVSVQFFTPDSADPVRVPAEVVWSTIEDDQGSMGLKFISLDEPTEKVVREFGRRLRLEKHF